MKSTIFAFLILHCLVISTKAQWVLSNNGLSGSTAYSFCKNTDFIYVGMESYGIYKSSDYGGTWQFSNLAGTAYSLAAYLNDIYAGFYQTGLYKSTNNGANWIGVMYSRTINSIGICGNNILAGYFAYFYPSISHGVLVSTNSGGSWIGTNIDEATGYCFASNDTFGFTGLQYYGVYRSSNCGLNWSQTSLNNKTVQTVIVAGNKIYAGTYDGLYTSSDNGMNWTQSTIVNVPVQSLAAINSHIIVGTIQNGVFVSSNLGNTWAQKNEGFDSIPPLNALMISNGYILAGTSGHSVWRRPLSEILGTENNYVEIPLKCKLYQNFPNPFNTSTKIKFSVPTLCSVSILIYNISGKEIQKILDGKLLPGTYESTFDGSRLSSGIFFYKIFAGAFSETRRMILIK